MTLPLWLVNLGAYSLQVAVLVTATALVVAGLRVRPPRARLVIWQAILIGCLALPFLQPWRAVPAPRLDTAIEDVVTTSMSAVATESAAGAEALGGPWLTGLVALLITGALLRLAWLGLGLLRLARYRRDMTPLDPLPPPFLDAAALVGVRPTIGVAPGLSGPATFGLRRPLVLIPPAVLALEPALQQSVVCHELLHVRRRDWIWSVAEEVVCAAGWFHPAIWWLTAQIDLAREQLVDAEVVRLTGGRKPYLEALLYLASPDRGADLVPAPALLRRRHLVKRLRVLAQEVSMSRSRIALLLAVVGMSATITAGAAAVSFPLVGPAANDADAVLSAAQAPQRVGGDIAPPKKIVDVRPVYPPDAREAGVQGAVIIEVLIGKDGRVEDAKVLRSVPALDQAALDAVRQWVFTPTLLNGAAVPLIMTVTVNFKLDGAKSAGVEGGVTGGVAGGVTGGVAGGVAGGVSSGVQTGAKEPQHKGPQPPKRTYYVAPVYPEEAHAQKVEGTVVLEVLVGTNGLASDVKVLKGHDLLNTAAVDAVKKWKWDPPAMPMMATITVRFALDKDAGQAEFSKPADTKLEIANKVDPVYPPEAKKAKLSGTISLEIVVDEKGAVSSARVLEGPDAFHQAALDAVRQWTFKAPGKPVKTTISVKFTLH